MTGVDPSTVAQWGITVDQYNAARPMVRAIKADIREQARLEADRLESWLLDNDLANLSRPTRKRSVTDIHGARRHVRSEHGYDWLEQLTDQETARVRLRMVDNDLYRPDLLADQVRRKQPYDWTDDEAIDWLVGQWLLADALRSVASGRLPRYGDPAALLPATYALDGYDLTALFGVTDEEATCHVASVIAANEQASALAVLGSPVLGPAPWLMDAGDYVAELEALDVYLSGWRPCEGLPADPEYRLAVARWRELVPPELEVAATCDYELHEQIRAAALAVGLVVPVATVRAAPVGARRRPVGVPRPLVGSGWAQVGTLSPLTVALAVGESVAVPRAAVGRLGCRGPSTGPAGDRSRAGPIRRGRTLAGALRGDDRAATGHSRGGARPNGRSRDATGPVSTMVGPTVGLGDGARERRLRARWSARADRLAYPATVERRTTVPDIGCRCPGTGAPIVWPAVHVGAARSEGHVCGRRWSAVLVTTMFFRRRLRPGPLGLRGFSQLSTVRHLGRVYMCTYVCRCGITIIGQAQHADETVSVWHTGTG